MLRFNMDGVDRKFQYSNALSRVTSFALAALCMDVVLETKTLSSDASDVLERLGSCPKSTKHLVTGSNHLNPAKTKKDAGRWKPDTG